MISENEYRNAVRYLQNLLNGGLMGARGTSPLMTAIEACELQIPKHPISKSWSPNLCPHCNADLGGDCNDVIIDDIYNPIFLSVVSGLIIVSKGA